MSNINWEIKAAEKRSKVSAAIPQEWRLSSNTLTLVQTPLETSRNNLVNSDIVRASGILSQQEVEITENYNVQQLLSALAQGTFSAVEVTTAFSKRAAIAQQLVPSSDIYLTSYQAC